MCHDGRNVVIRIVERREDRCHVRGEGEQTLGRAFDSHRDVIGHLVHPEIVCGVVEALLLDAAQHAQDGFLARAANAPSRKEKA